MQTVIVSPVGISLLLKSADDALRKALNECTNLSKIDFPEDVLEKVIELEDNLQKRLPGMDTAGLRNISAELNGLLGIYNGTFENAPASDIHFLICTDTFLGEIAGKLLQNFLKKRFSAVDMVVPTGLSTADKNHFQRGVKELLTWCEETLKGYQQSGYTVIFNLTASFKSLQSYLNTFGIFYADQIVYIFETGNEMLDIPKLPISIDEQLFKKRASVFAQLYCDKFFDKLEIQDIPLTLLEEMDETKVGLSTWGRLAWNNVKEKILSEKLLNFPVIAYEDSFKKDFSNTTSPTDKVRLQETVCKVSCLLQEKNHDVAWLKGGRGGGLLYDNYTGKNAHLGHFRISQGERVSCQWNNNRLSLRHFGSHDYVNDNP